MLGLGGRRGCRLGPSALIGITIVLLLLYVGIRQGLVTRCRQQFCGTGIERQSAAKKPQATRSLSPWQPLLTEEEQRRGVGYLGSGIRLRKLAIKLLSGAPIKVFFLGGSVTFTSYSTNWGGGWRYPQRLAQFINFTFPHREHEFHDMSLPGSTSSLAAPCAEVLVAEASLNLGCSPLQDADLVILEYTFNDHPNVPLLSPERRAYEQLLRKVLRLPSQPCVVILNHYSYWQADWQANRDGKSQGAFYTASESQFTVLAQYYDVPSLSLRAAAWRLMHAGVDGFRVDKLAEKSYALTIGTTVLGKTIPQAPNGSAELYFYQDSVHPTRSGHTALADILCGLLRRGIEEAKSSNAVAERTDARIIGLPPPMIPNNPDRATSFCALLKKFQAVVTKSEGFNYLPERPTANSFAGQKWGWTGTRSGAWAELELDTRSGVPERNGSAVVHLMYLKTYEHAGVAQVSCASGCSCGNTALLNATNTVRVSTISTYRWGVTQHARCHVRVQIIQQESKAAEAPQKIMLVGVSVSHI